MITCRYLIRVDQAWKFKNSHVLSKPAQYLQRCCFYHGLNFNWKKVGAKDVQSVMDKKKRKTVTPVWRPVCTQSSSYEESLVKDMKVYFEISHSLDDGGRPEVVSQVEAVHYCISSRALNTQHAHGEAEVVNEPVTQNFSSLALQDSDEGRAPGRSTPSFGKHSISVEAGASLIRFIKGKGGSTQKQIEEEMEVKIIFPSSKNEDSIIIEGISADSVARASEKIQVIIDEAVKNPTLDYSHFISLPLAIHPELVDKLVNFQNSILGINNPYQDKNLDSDSSRDSSDEEDHLQSNGASRVAVELKAEEDNKHVKVDMANIPLISYPPKASKSSTLETKSTLSDLGIDQSIFIKPKTFHLTVLMLKLWNKDRVDAAAEVLQSVSSKVMDALDGRPVYIRLKGLECMRGSLAKARVLYAPVEVIGGEDRLLCACQVIIDAFVKAGLVLEKDAQQKLKLHATLMNARHRKREKRTRKVDSFDARGIVNQYGSEEWGEYLIREAHLSQRFVFEENGYYRCRASIPFPVNMQLE